MNLHCIDILLIYTHCTDVNFQMIWILKVIWQKDCHKNAGPLELFLSEVCFKKIRNYYRAKKYYMDNIS